MFEKMITRIPKAKREQGSALVLALVSLAILAMVGASFALMVQSEVSSVSSNILGQKALYVAESGIENVLYQRSKKPEQMCFPYYYYDSGMNEAQRIDTVEAITGARSVIAAGAPRGPATQQ